jgi:signal transduction histidine kinase
MGDMAVNFEAKQPGTTGAAREARGWKVPARKGCSIAAPRRRAAGSGQALAALAKRRGLERLLGRVLHALSRRMSAQRVSLWLKEEASDFPVFYLSFKGGRLLTRLAARHPVLENPALWWQDPLGRDLLRVKRPILCLDIPQDPRLAQRREYLLAQGTRTLLVLPLLVAGEVIGFVSLHCDSQRRFRNGEIEVAQALAQQAILAVEMTRIAEHSREVAVLEERERMARDMHDTLAQGFTGVIVHLEVARQAVLHRQPDQALDHMRRATGLARESLAEARRSVRAMRPQALEGGDLLGALDRSLQRMTAGTRLQAQVRAQGRPKRLPRGWEEQLLRIGQEALTNTLKHAAASRFVARLVFDPGEVRLELRDDGRGFELAEPKGGFGLRGMRERVAGMGGQLSIESGAGKGTTIRVILPRQAAAEDLSDLTRQN